MATTVRVQKIASGPANASLSCPYPVNVTVIDTVTPGATPASFTACSLDQGDADDAAAIRAAVEAAPGAADFDIQWDE